jgi:HPt (histidine-containing phosphotransfer) domain-containing protein
MATNWSPDRMIARLAGDEELARQLVDIYIDECPRMLGTLRDAIAQASPDAIRRAAHALKGSTLNFIDGGPAATAFELETMGRESRLDDTVPAFARLEEESEALLDDLRRYQAKGACRS